jgi:hypothetical protein
MGINAINHGSINGTAGYATTFAAKDLDENLKINANCFPVLTLPLLKSICNSTNSEVSYKIEMKFGKWKCC